MNIKRIISILITLTLFITLFSSCGEQDNTKSYPLTVNNTPLDGEIFMYYLDEAFTEAEEQTRDGRITYATNMCIRYVATNSTFEAKGLSLSSDEKVTVSEEANSMWRLFEAHYKALGISKETFIKLRTNAAYTEKLRVSLFGKDGTTPIADSKLKEYFNSNYVAFKLVRGYLFTTDIYGNTVEYTQDELNAILERYNTAANQINGNTSIEFVYPSLVGNGEQEVEQSLKTVVIADADPYYPEGFYAQVKAIPVATASVCTFDDYIYLVYRVDTLADATIFEDYRDECLKAVSEIPLQSEINSMCNAYKSVRNTKLVDKYYTEITKVNKNG